MSKCLKVKVSKNLKKSNGIMKRFPLYVMFLALLFSACTKDVEFSGEETEPMLVVNGLQRVGHTPELFIEKSRFIVGMHPESTVKGLGVKLFVNDVFVEDLSVRDSLVDKVSISDLYGNAYYTSSAYGVMMNYCSGNYVYQEGDRVRFEITSDDFEPASASAIMPGQPVVDGLEVVQIQFVEEEATVHESISIGPDGVEHHTYDTIYPAPHYHVYFDLPFDDKPGTQYYNLSFGKGFAYATVNVTDPVFENYDVTGMLNGSSYMGDRDVNIFSDGLISETPYGLNFDCDFCYLQEGDNTFSVDLTMIDENYYKYVKSVNTAKNGDLMGELSYMFVEPTQIYSNIEGGVGIVGAMGVPATASAIIHHEEE